MQITLKQLVNWLQIEQPEIHTPDITITGVSTDTRTIEHGNLYIPLIGERFDGHDFISEAVEAGAAAILVERQRQLPDVDCPYFEVPDTLKALQQLAQAYRHHLAIPVVAVTGSNGKTTTKDLIAAVLSTKYVVHKTKGNLNNHIGLPLSLLSMPEQAEVAVLEMGMSHAGEIAQLSRIACPDYAVITNVGDAHIAFFNSQRDIAKAKLEIVTGLKPEGLLYVNGDNRLLREETVGIGRQVRTVGLAEDVDVKGVDVKVITPHTTSFRTENNPYRYELPLIGKHNVTNALFAVAIGRQMGLTESEIAHGLQEVQLSGRRLQLRETKRGMRVIDDSYNANPTAVRAGVNTLTEVTDKQRKWVLLGDIFELGAREEQLHRELGRFVRDKKSIEYIFTIGKRARWIHEEALGVDRTPDTVIHFHTVEEAIHDLRRRDNPDTVLLVKASRGMALDRVVDALCH